MKKFEPKDFIAAFHGVKDYTVPKGWSTIEQIRQELNLAHPRNASSRAYELFRHGMLERVAHQFKAKTGQCHQSYVYRPVKPYRSITEAAANSFKAREDKVPKGWVRVMEYSFGVGVSHVAIRGRIDRAGIVKRYFKTCRGISGLHTNTYYRKADLDRLLRKRP